MVKHFTESFVSNLVHLIDSNREPVFNELFPLSSLPKKSLKKMNITTFKPRVIAEQLSIIARYTFEYLYLF